MIKLLTITLLVAISVYALICLFMYFFQKNLIHIPYEQLITHPMEFGMEYEEVNLSTPDNARLHAWFIPHRDARYTFWIFSGNAGNKSYMMDSIRLIHDLGHSVFIYDYRTYGPSSGRLTEQTMYQDTELVWDYLTRSRDIPAEQIVLHGRSLGTAMATWVASKTKPAAVILESGFSSMTEMARSLYGWLPIQLLLRWRYDNLSRIQKISAPILFIHSPDDELVPYVHSQRLFDAATAKKEFIEISGNHLEGFMNSGDIYTEGIERFINDLESPTR